MTRFILAVLAYLIPTFVLGFVWHLILFENYYKALQIYRDDVVIPFGLLSMLIQAVIFAGIYSSLFLRSDRRFLSRVFIYSTLGAALSWSFTTLAVAAKNIMTSVPNYLLIETGFTLVQWIMVGPLTVLVFGRTTEQRQAISGSTP
jgi:hypothetical protein